MAARVPAQPRTLFEPARIGKMTLKNRVAMAPITRNRGGADGGSVYGGDAEGYTACPLR